MLKTALERALKALFPEIRRGYHLPMRGQVLKVSDLPEEEALADEFRPRYACDVRVLTQQGKPDERHPVLLDVPLPFFGLYAPPRPGSIVRVEFDYGDPAYPVISGVLTQGQIIPELEREEILLTTQQSASLSLSPGRVRAESSRIETFAKEIKEEAVEATRNYDRADQTTKGDATESVGGKKTTRAGTLALTATSQASLAALLNTEISSAVDLSLVAGKRIQIAAPSLQIKGSPGANGKIAFGIPGNDLKIILENTRSCLRDLAASLNYLFQLVTGTNPVTGQSGPPKLLTTSPGDPISLDPGETPQIPNKRTELLSLQREINTLRTRIEALLTNVI